MSDSDSLTLRIYSDTEGKVFLMYEPRNWRVEVQKPVTRETLDAARIELVNLGSAELQTEQQALEGENEALATAQQRANRQLKAILEPPAPGFLHFVKRLGAALFEGLLLLVLLWLTVAIPYVAISWSQENLPEAMHLVVLLVVAAVLALAIYVMSIDEVRTLALPGLKVWFGRHALFSLPALTLILAAAVFSSLTFMLYNRGWVVLEPCAGYPVSPGRLADFYVWHFFKLVPFVKLNETLKWNEPLCYTQARVGFLILLFQALVVLPSINTIRYYWKNRRSLTAKPYEYIYEPGWKPENDLKQ